MTDDIQPTTNDSETKNDHNRAPTGSGQDDRGLWGKYRVERVDSRDVVFGPHYGCALFVLDLTHDPHARSAALDYAESAASTRPVLAAELRAKVAEAIADVDEHPGFADPDSASRGDHK